MKRLFLILLPFTAALVACTSFRSTFQSLTPVPSSPGVISLSQGWSTSDSEWFYTTTQGSQLMPLQYYLALEQSGNTAPFNDSTNIRKYRCLPQTPSPRNPEGLPVGFVPDSGTLVADAGLLSDPRSLGFTCAACHTGQIDYRGKSLRIDGGPSLADFDALMSGLLDSVNATLQQTSKFDRFAKKVLGERAQTQATRTSLRESLGRVSRVGGAYVHLNQSDVPYGFGRLDAFGRIFNRALTIVESPHHVVPNAPVSFPFLWDTPRADSVQWTGSAKNGLVGSLARNVGEVIGVFASVDNTTRRPPIGYATSANFHNLRGLERRLRGLSAPAWPNSVFGTPDAKLLPHGKELFAEHCVGCHRNVNPFPLAHSFFSVLTPVEDVGAEKGVHTDPKAAALIRDSMAPTGILKGARKKILVGDETYGDRESVATITADTVGRALVGKLEHKKIDSTTRRVPLATDGVFESTDADALIADQFTADKATPLKYRARPLDGIWATAPFLHNGSVPTLYDLLLPASQRPQKFWLGSREYDAAHVGYETTATPGGFLFDTKLSGNYNTGHEYGTKISEADRLALLEYLKTL